MDDSYSMVGSVVCGSGVFSIGSLGESATTDVDMEDEVGDCDVALNVKAAFQY